MNDIVFSLTREDAFRVGIGFTFLCIGLLVGWVKGFGDGLDSTDKENPDG